VRKERQVPGVSLRAITRKEEEKARAITGKRQYLPGVFAGLFWREGWRF
jgi:hypothetical protein